ncbi:unnamed protein product [Phaeothamnion confervicola]
MLGTAAKTETATGGGGIRLNAGTVGRTRRVLFVDERVVQNLQIGAATSRTGRRERLLRYDSKDNKTVRSLLAQRCKLHALIVLEGMEDSQGRRLRRTCRLRGRSSERPWRSRGVSHGTARPCSVPCSATTWTRTPLERSTRTADSQAEAGLVRRGGARAHRALANLVLDTKYAPFKNAYYYSRGEPWRIADLWEATQLCHMEAKQEIAARSGGGASPAYGAIESADTSVKKRGTAASPREWQRMQR